MRGRDWGGTAAVAAVIALIGYLHDHTVAAIFLVGVAVIGAFLVYVDVARERAWWPFSKRRHPTTPGALVTTKEARELLAAPEQASSDKGGVPSPVENR